MKASNKQKSLSLLLKSYNGFSHGFLFIFLLEWKSLNGLE